MSQPKKKRPVRARMTWTDLWEEGGCGLTLSVQRIVMLRDQLASDTSWRGNTHIAEKETSDGQDKSNKWLWVVQMWAKSSGLWILIAKVRLLSPRESAPPRPQGMQEAHLPRGRMYGVETTNTQGEPLRVGCVLYTLVRPCTHTCTHTPTHKPLSTL